MKHENEPEGLPVCNFCETEYDPHDKHICAGNMILPRKEEGHFYESIEVAHHSRCHTVKYGSDKSHCDCDAKGYVPADGVDVYAMARMKMQSEVQEALKRNAATYPDNNPKTAFGMAKIPMDLCPPALTRGAAEAFANGAAKYGAYNWREKMISSSVYYAACKRHLDDWWDRVDENDVAPDSLVHHLKHAAACIGMILDTMNSELLNDNRPPKVTRK